MSHVFITKRKIAVIARIFTFCPTGKCFFGILHFHLGSFLHERNLCDDCARRGKTGNDANGRMLFSVHTVFLSPLSDMEARPSVNTAYLDISNVLFLFCKQMHLSNNASHAEKSSESDGILQAFSLN